MAEIKPVSLPVLLGTVCAQTLGHARLLAMHGLAGSSVHGLLQARILEWVAIPYSRGSPQPKDRTRISCVSCIGRWTLYHCAIWEAPWGLSTHLLICSEDRIISAL